MRWICYDENATFRIEAKSHEHAQVIATVYDAKVLGPAKSSYRDAMDTLAALIGTFNKSHSAETIIRKINAEAAALGIKTSAEYLPAKATSFRLFMLPFIDHIQASKVSAELNRFHSSIIGYNTVVFRIYD